MTDVKKIIKTLDDKDLSLVYKTEHIRNISFVCRNPVLDIGLSERNLCFDLFLHNQGWITSDGCSLDSISIKLMFVTRNVSDFIPPKIKFTKNIAELCGVARYYPEENGEFYCAANVEVYIQVHSDLIAELFALSNKVENISCTLEIGPFRKAPIEHITPIIWDIREHNFAGVDDYQLSFKNNFEE